MKKNLKKVCCILLNIVIILTSLCSLTGCGNDSDKQNNSGDSHKSSESRLVDVVKVGDTVNYNANLGLSSPKKYTTSTDLVGYSDKAPYPEKDAIKTYSSEDEVQWSVLNVDKESGIVELVSSYSLAQPLYIYGKVGYENLENVLNDIGAVYGYGEGATGGRSINIDDINNLTGYSEYKTEVTDTKTCGDECSKFPSKLPNGITVKGNSLSIDNAHQNYGYDLNQYIRDFDVFTILLGDIAHGYYWLASRSAVLFLNIKDSYCASFYGRKVNERGVVDSQFLCTSTDSSANNYGSNHVKVVVSLKPDIKTSGQDSNGTWQLLFE